MENQEILNKINQVMEQPEESISPTSTVKNTDIIATDGEETSKGSISKFKSREELEKAYKDLEKEFTKKCQKLSAYEKSKAEDNVNTPKADEISLKDKVKDFIVSTPNALQYADEIEDALKNDTNLQNNPELAYNRILSKKYIPDSELVKNDDFLNEYIYSNDEIKNHIIETYMKNLTLQKIPMLISGKGTGVPLARREQPTTLHEAGMLAEKILKTGE